MKGLLVRVGIDSSCGYWCSPVSRDGSYVYVPIPESDHFAAHGNLGRSYSEVEPALSGAGVELPGHLRALEMHLDPDFEHLTFGDQGQRGEQIKILEQGDFLAFYGAFKRYDVSNGSLIYALFGLLTVDEIVAAKAVSNKRRHENAHTRRVGGDKSDDIVVRGRSDRSGRFNRLLPIGEYRSKAYRVRENLLQEWGDINVRNGYIQRSVRLPAFKDPGRFMAWLNRQTVHLIQSNW